MLQDEPEILLAYKNSWVVQNGELVRTSFIRNDIAWTEWLCRRGFAGYIAPKLGGFHAELFLCEWKTALKFVGAYDTRAILQTDFCNEPYYSLNCELMGN